MKWRLNAGMHELVDEHGFIKYIVARLPDKRWFLVTNPNEPLQYFDSKTEAVAVATALARLDKS